MSGNGKQPPLDPSSMTADQLHVHMSLMIARGFSELTNYNFVPDDLMTSGVHNFIGEIKRARAWNNRVLGMLQEVRQLSAQISRIAKGKKRVFESAMSTWLREAKANNSLPKGVDATERKALARLACSDQEQEVEVWEELKQVVKDYVDCLKDKQDDLANVKQDLRSQLWAVRVHGVLGEFTKDGASGSFHRDPNMDGAARSVPSEPPVPRAPFSEPTVTETAPQKDVDIDSLLDT